MIYLDNAATTIMREEVLAAMLPYMREQFANPAASYRSAKAVRDSVEHARFQCASLINAHAEGIVFNSGGTESDNHALIGALGITKKNHIVTTAIEHHAILNTCEMLSGKGVTVTILPVDSEGMVSPKDVADAITEDTALVSVMTANNEVGTIEPVAKIGGICREKGVLFHTDAVQAYGHIPLDVEEMSVDLLSASAHKLGGPKGVGLLYVRPGLRLPPLLFGGGQEKGLRAGTTNTAGIVGFGMAAELAKRDMIKNTEKISAMRNRLIERVLTENPGAKLNGHPTNRLPGNASFTFEEINGEELLMLLDAAGICASTGSACSAGNGEPSHVLLAMGLTSEEAQGSLRLTLSEDTTPEEIEQTADTLTKLIEGLNEF